MHGYDRDPFNEIVVRWKRRRRRDWPAARGCSRTWVRWNRWGLVRRQRVLTFAHALAGYPLLEDLVVAERVRQRLADDTGERLSVRELDQRLGLDRADIGSEAAVLRAELGLS